jgi:cellulose synthase (UDP-forming)
MAGEAETALVGCRYMPVAPEEHRLVADLIFANSQQWSEFQQSRRGNPGLIRGTARFLWLAGYQTVRGLGYALRLLRTEDAPKTARLGKGA